MDYLYDMCFKCLNVCMRGRKALEKNINPGPELY